MNKLAVARLGKSVGLRGFVRFFDLSDFGEQFKKGAKFLGEKDEYFYFDILGCKVFETRAFEKVDLNFKNSACGAGQLRDSAAIRKQSTESGEWNFVKI